jgi:protoporphyrinogen IX oxidase
MLYPWLKALHVAAAVTFASGVLATALILSLRRDLEAGSWRDRHADRLRGWHSRVTTPAMLTVWALGLVLARQGGWFADRWLHAKLILVVTLSVVHAVQSGVLRRLANGSSPALRAPGLGPLPILVLIAAIVILAVLKPA